MLQDSKQTYEISVTNVSDLLVNFITKIYAPRAEVGGKYHRQDEVTALESHCLSLQYLYGGVQAKSFSLDWNRFNDSALGFRWNLSLLYQGDKVSWS